MEKQYDSKMFNQMLNDMNKIEDSELECSDTIMGGIILIENSISNRKEYIKNLLKPYHDDCEPYVIETMENAMKEYDEDRDCYDDINDYCKKIYGGYIDGANVMSTTNYDALWSTYTYVCDYFPENMDEIILPTKVTMIIDKYGVIHKKFPKNIYSDNSDCVVAYIEYTLS